MRTSVLRSFVFVLVVCLVAGACSSDDGPTATEEAAPSPTEDPRCHLSGGEVPSGVDASRPAIAVKIENNPAAYPLSGLEDAEIVFEEEVEGGLTRFMAIYHCTDVKKAGPVRSARIVDPALMSPITLIMANAGGNDIVRKALDKAGIIVIDEDAAGKAMTRVARPGVSLEHTLYGNTKLLRDIGQKKFDDPPPGDLFAFGPPPSGGKKAKGVTLHFVASSDITYRWNGSKWLRFQEGQPFRSEANGQITVDNLIIEQHTVNYSKTIVDAAGNPSIEIADEIGSGTAFLFRDGMIFKGKWTRKSLDSPVVYTTTGGDVFTLHEGNTWIELLPNSKGQVKGSFEFRKN